MRLPALLIADLHLDAAPSTRYRWSVFPWLRETIKEERVASLCILGDLVDKKDNHPSELVNEIAAEMCRFDEELDIFMIPGNHEWLKEGHEFFRFLRMRKNIRYFTEPSEDGVEAGVRAMFLPFTKSPAAAWKGLDFTQFFDYVFMHQTIKGSVSSNGMEMEGEELPDLRDWPKIYSGDIHVPQKIGPVEYVGSPYHVHFGDNFKPRCVLLEKGGRAVDLHFKSPRRVALKATGIEDLSEQLESLSLADHVKATIELSEAEKHEWPRIRREATDLFTAAGVALHGLSLSVQRSGRRLEASSRQECASDPADAVYRYVRREELTPDAYELAIEVIQS